MHSGQYQSSISGVIAWRGIILFVGGFMLFIYNDKPQIVEWEKNSGPNAYHKGDISIYNTSPDLYTFIVRKFRMINAHFGAEEGLQSSHDLSGKGDLR